MCRSIKPARTEIFSSESGVNRLKDLHTGAEGQGADLGHHMVFLGFFLIWPFLHGLLSFAIVHPSSIVHPSNVCVHPSNVCVLRCSTSQPSTLLALHAVSWWVHTLSCFNCHVYSAEPKRHVHSSDLAWASTPVIKLPTRHFYLIVPHMSQIQLQHHSFSIWLIILSSLSWKMERKPLIVSSVLHTVD